MDEAREVTQRARYIGRTTELREIEAKAVAYSEQGYSFNGVAKQIDVAESTTQQYMERAMALYGLDIAEPILPNEDYPDYERVGPGYHRQLHKKDQKLWIKYVDRHRDKLPQEWVHNVIETAREDGIKIAVVASED